MCSMVTILTLRRSSHTAKGAHSCRTGRSCERSRRSQFHPRSTASSPGSARKNFWRVVIVDSPCGRTRQNFLVGPGLPSPELDPAPQRWE